MEKKDGNSQQMYTNVNLCQSKWSFFSKYVPVVPNNSVNESKVLWVKPCAVHLRGSNNRS